MARKKFPGQKNSLDALCRRYGIEHFDRELHGALLDSKILAEVYLMLTGGQTALQLGSDLDNSEEVSAAIKPVIQGVTLPVIQPTLDEIEAHEKMLALLDKKSGGACLWKQLEGVDANG